MTVDYKNILDQKTFKEIESLCTQEDLPECNATCPLHIDVRMIMKNIKNNEENKAYKEFTRLIPFPKIISSTCSAPCEKSCKRKEVDESLNINEIERYLVKNYHEEFKKPLFMPKRKEKVAIIGGGLRGMMAAYDLAMKGFQISIYEKKDRLGGSLNKLEALDQEDLESEIGILREIGIDIKYNRKIEFKDIEEIKDFLEEEGKDGIYISNKDSRFFPKGDRLSQLIDGELNIFSGGTMGDSDSTIDKLYDGKSVSLSLDRSLKKVSLLAGREKEGPYKTKLFTDIKNIKKEGVIKKTGEIYSREEVKKEAARCIECECLECVKACSFMQYYNSYPKKYVREVYNNLSIAMGIHHANIMINSCNLCGQCESICPNGLDMGKVFLAARNIMVESKKMPPSAFEFGILDMDYSNGEDFFLARHEYGKEKSKYIYFPSCQLGASEPELVIKVYEDLQEKLEGGVGILLSCCNIMAKWAGEEDLFKENINRLKITVEEMGNPTIISSCPMCLKTLKEDGNMKVEGIWNIVRNDKFQFKTIDKEVELAVYDSCSARYDKETQKNIRYLAEDMGYSLKDMDYSLEKAPCCGFGGMLPISNRPLSEKITEDISKISEEVYLTYCVNCRDRLLDKDKDAYHILELLYDIENLRRRPPTWSARQDNRKYLKKELLSKYWGDELVEELDINLYISKELEEVLDERLILYSDIQKAVDEAERTKNYFEKMDTGHYITSYSPKNVTFWIEYTKENDGYRIYNAYSHRMKFKIMR